MQVIERIGKRVPYKQKKSHKNWFFCSFLLLILAGIYLIVVKPLFADINDGSKNQVTKDNRNALFIQLLRDGDKKKALSAWAIEQSLNQDYSYNNGYYEIAYPMGDLPSKNKGNDADVIVRALRNIGIDLQQRIHEDMKANLADYPQLWEENTIDRNIDHRRLANIKRYLSRHAQIKKPSRNDNDYQHGDIVFWIIPPGVLHVGIVVPGPGEFKNEKWVVHALKSAPAWENKLFEWQVNAHFSVENL